MPKNWKRRSTTATNATRKLMQGVLVILFTLLWKFNKNICSYFYPNYLQDSEDWYNWYYLRCDLYEWMFLILIIAMFFKRNRFSWSVIAGCTTIVLMSVIDKSGQNVHATTIRDYLIVFPAGIFVGSCFWYIYRKYEKLHK